MNNFRFFDFGKPRHQVWVKPEDQERARERAHVKTPVRSKSACPKCGGLFAGRKMAAHKLECKG